MYGTPVIKLALRFHPDEGLIRSVRTFLANFCERALADPDIASRVEVTTYELVENAANHSTDGTVELELTVEGSSRLQLRISNRVTADQLPELLERFAEMKRFDDPLAYYVSLMHATADRKDGSGLGLARVMAEAGMSLDLEVHGDRVDICAGAQLNGRES
jgi:hypothetical protein